MSSKRNINRLIPAEHSAKYDVYTSMTPEERARFDAYKSIQQCDMEKYNVYKSLEGKCCECDDRIFYKRPTFWFLIVILALIAFIAGLIYYIAKNK